MKSLKISIVAAIFFSFGVSVFAQNHNNSAVVFSQRKEKKAVPVKVYYDTSYNHLQTEEVILNLKGEMGLPEVDKDSIVGVYDSTSLEYEYAARIKRFHSDMNLDYFDDYYTDRYYYSHNPLDWGTSIYVGCAWSPWYWNHIFNPYWGWMHPYYDPFAYPYWGSYVYWGYDFYWGYDYWGYNDYYYHPYGGSHNGTSGTNPFRPNQQQIGHAQMGGSQDPHNPHRRGGVDLNNNGRTSSGNIRQTDNGASRTMASNAVSGSHFSKPKDVTEGRTAATSPNRGSSDRNSYASTSSNYNSRSTSGSNYSTSSAYRTSGYNTGSSASSRSMSTGSSNTYHAGSNSSFSGSRSSSSFSSGSSMSSRSSSFSSGGSSHSSSFSGSSHSSS